MNRAQFLKCLGLGALSAFVKCGRSDEVLQGIQTSTNTPIVVLYANNTVSAYDKTRGSNLYQGKNGTGRIGRDRIVPYIQGVDSCASGFMTWLSFQQDKHLFRMIEDKDMENPNVLSDAKVLVVVGHSEYWTRTARINFDAFVASGGHVALLSGDVMGVQIRFEATDIVCYKVKSEDPILDPTLKTVFWNDPTLGYPIESSIGNSYSHGGYMTDALGHTSKYQGYKLVSQSPIFDGIDTKKVLCLRTHESDGAPLKGFDVNGTPIVDTNALGFYKFELLGFDIGSEYENDPDTEFTVNADPKAQTFIAFQKTPTSGIVINVASTDWCKEMTGDLAIVTRNIIFKLLNNERVFS